MEFLPHEKKIYEYLESIERLKEKNQDSPLFKKEIAKLDKKLRKLKKEVYGSLTPWERVTICRHPSRPHTLDYIAQMCDSFHELAGDRTFGDDPAVVGGLATIGDMTCLLLGQEKGKDTQSRVERNFGMLYPEGFRKALRLMRLAEKFQLPIVNLLDTPGAFPGLVAEERGPGGAIALNLREMVRIATPIIIVIIGEGCSGGALGMGVGDVVAMLEHSYYSVISPEGCASILWKDNSKKVESASALKLNAENLLELKIVDTVLQEPLGGAHHDPTLMCSEVKKFILKEWNALRRIAPEVLLERRYLKFRQLGEVA